MPRGTCYICHPTRCTWCISSWPFCPASLTLDFQVNLPVLQVLLQSERDNLQNIKQKRRKSHVPRKYNKSKLKHVCTKKKNTVSVINRMLRRLGSAKHLHNSAQPHLRWALLYRWEKQTPPFPRRSQREKDVAEPGLECKFLLPRPVLRLLGCSVSQAAAHLSTTNNFPITFLNKSSASQSRRQGSVHFKKKNTHNAASVI